MYLNSTFTLFLFLKVWKSGGTVRDFEGLLTPATQVLSLSLCTRVIDCV